MNHYLLERDGETQIVAICEGNDPLYGRGSWNLQAGPYTSVELTKAAAEPLLGRRLHGLGREPGRGSHRADHRCLDCGRRGRRGAAGRGPGGS